MPSHLTLLLRQQLPLLADADIATHEQACTLIVEEYGSQTQQLLYHLLAEPDLRVRQQAALGLRIIDDWVAENPAQQSPRGFYVTCLGPVRVYDGNREISLHDDTSAARQTGDAASLKAFGMFTYLVHRGWAGATRAQISAALWQHPVSPSNLDRTLNTLRQALAQAFSPAFVAEALVTTSERCTLSPQAYLTDAQIFERVFQVALTTEEQQGLEAAMRFYALAVGRYAGTYLEGALCVDDTCLQQRQHLVSIFVRATERLAEAAYRQKYYRHCVSLCQDGLQADPASEELTIWLLRAWAALHTRDELEHAYRMYLHIAALDPRRMQDNQVVKIYEQLYRSKAINE